MSGKRVERRLAAVVAADVAGYSRLMGLDEVGTLEALKSHRRDVVDPAITAHNGRIVKTTGDGILIEFASAVDAVAFAMAVQEQMVERNGASSGPNITFRIGINVGDIIIDGDDIFGDGVNVAARVENECEPGGVYLSANAFEQVRSKTPFAFDDLGERQLKNIDRPVRVYAAKSRDHFGTVAPVVPSSAPDAKKSLPLPDKPSIAVLPFQNMSGDPEQEYFTDGMVEDIITALSRFKSLFVIARNSSFTYKGKAVEIKQVGRELGVRYVSKAVSERLAARSVSPASSLMPLPVRIYGPIGSTELWTTSLSCRTRSPPAWSRQSRPALNRRKSNGRSANRPKASTPSSCITTLSTLIGIGPAREMKMLCGLLGKRFPSIPILRRRMAWLQPVMISGTSKFG